MHELSIALSILDIAQEESSRRCDASIKAIYMRLGPLSGVVKEALLSAFEIAREASPFGDCRLIIEDVPVMVYCRACEAERPVDSMQWMCCSHCGTFTANVVSGREMEITAMEIEEADRTACQDS